jgi:hypothetical protein
MRVGTPLALAANAAPPALGRATQAVGLLRNHRLLRAEGLLPR